MDVQCVGEWLVAKLDKSWSNRTLEQCLMDGLYMSSKKINHLLDIKAVMVDTRLVSRGARDAKLEPGMQVRVQVLQKEGYGVEPDYHPEVDVVWEDEHCLVVNKPADMLVHPDEPGRKGTLDAAVAYHYLVSGLETKVRHVHRLDRDTSGLVLFAKHVEAHRILDHQLAEKEVIRSYYAVVQGQVAKKRGRITDPIGRDRHNRQKRIVSPSGADAATTFERVKSWVDPEIGSLSLLRLQLETGRTHQIRVHVSHMGHPIVGDTLYGGRLTKRLATGRHALHAYQLEFTHPYSSERIQTEIGWAEDLRSLLPNSNV